MVHSVRWAAVMAVAALAAVWTASGVDAVASSPPASPAFTMQEMSLLAIATSASLHGTHSHFRRMQSSSTSFALSHRVLRKQQRHSFSQQQQQHRQLPCSTMYGYVSLSKSKGMAEYSYQGFCEPRPRDASVVAWCVWSDKILESGWGELTLETSAHHTDLEQAFAAGYLEGAITQKRIWQISKVINRNHRHESVRDYFRKQNEFLRTRVADVDPAVETSVDRYWFQVALVLAQLDGVLAGYNSQSPAEERLTADDMWLINGDGDVLDVERAATPGRVFKRTNDMTKAELIELISLHGRCSAMVKWTGDELFAAHTTWDDYTELLRVYKHYNLQFQQGGVKSRRVSHSSYPGFIFSSDDFYILDTGLVIIETTLNILDEKLYDLCNPSSTVLAWIRNLVANRLASTGKEWVDIFAQHNSGTYNDQWIVVDYKLFHPGLPALKPHTVWIMEQIPGYVESKDVSEIITKDSYWASYNRPFFEEVNTRSMYRHYTNMHGEMFSYHQCPRAKIFMRDQGRVRTMKDVQQLMMSNNWQNDPYSQGCPGNAIAARFDIEAPNCSMTRVANGATDSKVTSWGLSSKFIAMAIAGPSHETQQPFSWDNPMFEQEEHEGQPTVWDFDWVEMRPATI